MKRTFGIFALAALIAGSFTIVSHGTASVPRERTVSVAVTRKGFEPATIKVKANQPLRLVVTRKVERTCATEIVVKDLGISQALPLGRPVEVRFTPKKSGSIRYACAMDMIAGELIVQ